MNQLTVQYAREELEDDRPAGDSPQGHVAPRRGVPAAAKRLVVIVVTDLGASLLGKSQHQLQKHACILSFGRGEYIASPFKV